MADLRLSFRLIKRGLMVMYKVILLDDEYMILKGLQKMIQWEGLGIECVGAFSNGQEALDYVKENPVDIAITDVNMPVLSGIDFVEKSQDLGINFNFIILSGYQEFEYVRQGIRLGAENFLLKPISKHELHESLKKTIEKLNLERHHLETDELVFDSTIKRWINNEIESVDLKRMLKHSNYPLEVSALFTVVVLSGIGEDIHSILRSDLHSLGINYSVSHNGDVVAIVQGNRESFSKMRHDLTLISKRLKFKIAIGERLVNFENVGRSYLQALSISQYQKFFNDDSLDTFSELNQNETLDINVDYKALHNALALGDFEMIDAEIDSIISKAVSEGAPPNYLKYISYIIFSDIFRNNENYASDQYHNLLNMLNEANHLKEILDILKSAVNLSSEDAAIKQYSSNVQNVLLRIFNDFHQDITISAIADAVHMNAMYLGQLFIKETGVSFSQYLNNYRIKEAQKLLLNSNHNINEIAELVGYTSSGYFYKNFKKECGISPREYREKYLTIQK